MKKIIFRVIVAVAVAIICSKLKLLGIINVSALEQSMVSSSDFCVYLPVNATCDSNLTTSNMWGREFKTYRYYGTLNIQSVSTLIPVNSVLNNKPLYVTGLFYSSGTNIPSGLNGLRAYIDGGASSMQCDIVPMASSVDTGQGYIATISCPNAITGSSGFRIFINGPFANYDGAYGFSRWALIYDNDSLLAQQQANQYLNDLKNSISSTNSKLDELIRQQQQSNSTQNDIKNNTKETNDLIKDDSSISNDKITDITNIDTNTSNTPVSDLITLPISLLNKYSTSMSSSCSPYNLGNLLGTDLILPCINLEQRLGSNLWNIIDKLFSFFMVFNIAMFCITIFESLTSLHDDFYSAYSPRHTDNGKHGGGS